MPSSAEFALREERRRAVVRAVDALPDPLRAVVLLRYFESLPPRMIARELGVPVTAVWNRLRRAHELLRARLDAAHGGDRRAWLVPLVPYAAARPPALAAGGTGLLFVGALAMLTKTKLIALGGAALAAVLLWLPDGAPAPGTAPPEGASPEARPLAAASRDEAGARMMADERRSLQRAPPAAPATGRLVVTVTYAEDGSPAQDVLVRALPQAEPDIVYGHHRARTDAEGRAVFADLPPGFCRVDTDRDLDDRSGEGRVEIEPGAEAILALALGPGVRIVGRVVDGAGLGVADADVFLGSYGRADRHIERVATTSEDGRFLIRSAPKIAIVGTRADGYEASAPHSLVGSPGAELRLQMVLAARGGALAGTVVGPSRSSARSSASDSERPAGSPPAEARASRS